MANGNCTGDDYFGPAVSGSCRDEFDFTLLFEQTILTIAPASILLLLAPYNLVKLIRGRVKTLPNNLGFVKAIPSLLLIGLRAALLVLWTQHPLTRASVAAAALQLAAAFAVLCLSLATHSRAVRPSSLLAAYLVASVALDAVQLRTLCLRGGDDAPARALRGVAAAALAAEALLLLLEEAGLPTGWGSAGKGLAVGTQHRRRLLLREPYDAYPPEATSGAVARSFFWWLTPLFMSGFRRLLTLDDLFVVDEELKSERLRVQILRVWDKYKSKGKHALAYATMRCFWRSLLRVVIPRLCLIGFTYAQPFLINRAISYVDNPDDNNNASDGYGLIGATALIYGGIAISTAQYQHQEYRAITMFRGAMASLIYARTLSLKADVYDESKALTLMSTDIDRLASAMQDGIEAWARIIEVAIGVWLLQIQVGWICVAPVVVVLASVFGATQVAKVVLPAQRRWVEAVQRRVAVISNALASMKCIKMIGLSDNLAKSIQRQRIRELALSAQLRTMSVYKNVIGPFSVFMIYTIRAAANDTSRLSTNQAFTSLSIIALLTTPASKLVQALPSFPLAVGCFDRIQVFLLSESWEDERNGGEINLSVSQSRQASDDGIEMRKLPAVIDDAVVVTDANISPATGAPNVLHDISTTVPKGSLTMIIGAVGSGKSTLLKAILGELRCSSGSITTASVRMGYCSQSIWLQNATVRQIVCGPLAASETDVEWYETVMHACALDEDVANFSDGHDSLIGSRGITLSGGQKQRLAMARAVYARQDVLLLDDVLSALDASTEQAIIERLLGRQGLLRKIEATIILATHAIQHLPMADKIIVLDPTGHIAEQGTWERLRAHGGVVQGMVHEPARGIGGPEAAGKSKPKKALSKALAGPSANDVADLSRRMGDMAVYGYYARSIGWKLGIPLIVSIVLNTFAQTIIQIWISWYTDHVVNSPAVFCVVYLVWVLLELVALGISMYVMFVLVIPRSGAILHKILLDTVMHAPQSFFDKTDMGVTLNRFSQDMTLVDGSLPVAVIITLQSLFNCMAQVALVAIGSSYMALTIPLLIPVLYALQGVYLRTSRQLRLLDLELKSPLYTHFLETLDGLPVLRSLAYQRAFAGQFTARLDASQRPYYLLYCTQRWLGLVLQLLVGLLAVVLVALATGLRGSSEGARLGVALNAVLGFSSNLETLVLFWTGLETSLGAVARTRAFERGVEREPDDGADVIVDAKWPAGGSIEFQGVSASYGPDVPAVNDISLTIAPGEKIGICGRTGSGKSSLLSTLLRILPTDSGRILISSTDVTKMPLATLRSRIITIPQDPFFLAGSVRHNADPSDTRSPAAIEAALRKVALWPLIEERGGLDASMEHTPLSRGEGQLFSLARALLRRHDGELPNSSSSSSSSSSSRRREDEGAGKKGYHHDHDNADDQKAKAEASGKHNENNTNTNNDDDDNHHRIGGPVVEGSILVLDEPTSSTDRETDVRVGKLLAEEFGNWTVLTVAHRLETISEVDRVVVLEAGRIVEVGRPDELRNREGGAYAGLWRGGVS